MPNKSDQKLITLCIATYNRSARVCELVQILLDFDLNESLEILIVDDGSSDDTFNQISKFLKYDNVQVYRNESNLGWAKTFIKYFNLCKTEYLVEVPDDDIIYKQGILDIFPILENLKPDFICTRWIDVNRADYPGRGSDSLQEISLLNIRSKSDHSPGCVYRTSLIESAEPIILQRLAKECMATFFYPQVILLYVAKLNNAKLYNSPVLMGGYKEEGPLESNLTDLKGNHYTSLGTIFMQYLGFQGFYKEMIIKFDHSKHIKELQLTLESHELSLYGLIDDAISIQSKISAHHFRIGSSRNLLNPFRLFSFFIIFLYQKIKTKFYAK
jgi:glycosyltransferase involved in cell wall biosynthesis